MKALIHSLAAAALVFLAGVQPATAQTSEEFTSLKQQIETLKQGQAAIAKELEAIRSILERATGQAREQPFQPTDITVAEAPFLGAADAPVTLVEFTDYQCPFCRRHTASVMPQLVKDYVETGKLRYVMREFPIASLHPEAVKGAEAALCAKDQGKYWEMHDLLFAEQRKMSVADLRAHGEALGLDMAAFNACLDEDKYAAAVKASIEEGARAGVRGTPSFFVGLSASDTPGKIKATKFVRGAQPLQVFQQTIEELLQQGS